MAKISVPPACPRTLIKRGAPISDMALDGWGRPLRPFSCHSGLDCKALRLHPPAPEERPLAASSLPLVKKPCGHFASPTILCIYNGPEDGRIGPAVPGFCFVLLQATAWKQLRSPEVDAFYTELPDVDLSGVPPAKLQALLKRLNVQRCTCDCGRSVASCRNHHRSCTNSLAAAREAVEAARTQ